MRDGWRGSQIQDMNETKIWMVQTTRRRRLGVLADALLKLFQMDGPDFEGLGKTYANGVSMLT